MTSITFYTRELLELHVPNVSSYSALARSVGKAPVGGTTTHLRNLCIRYELDVSHFTTTPQKGGSSHNKGKPALNKAPLERIFVVGIKGELRKRSTQLKRALIESGIEYKCAECPCTGEWNGRKLVLQVDHINGQYWDNRKENMRFLCPNCHSQTDTFGSKNK